MTTEERIVQYTKIAMGVIALAMLAWRFWPEEPDAPKFGFRKDD